jgi:hypothetical protein
MFQMALNVGMISGITNGNKDKMRVEFYIKTACTKDHVMRILDA